MAIDLEAVSKVARDYAVDVSRELPIEKAILFGSCARKTATELSDVDICFFLKSYNGKRKVDLVAQILGIGGEKYCHIGFEPIVFEISEIQRGNPFVREILATGIELL
ncbi:MAG: nucleotidyltransferase domain-containing protein [Spirochaetaceae bacterium]|nr:nucleotidyltransferase domain-containing protein [Spirochaetaceae bacterium]